MIQTRVKEKIGEFLELTEIEKVKPELTEYLTTYLKQYNQMAETYAWINSKLDKQQRQEWERTIHSLKIVVLALDAGFDPITPPLSWVSGQLTQYLAPIPEQVRKQIDLAVPIFGEQQILIYDPNIEHFRRPRQTDPLVIGFVNLAMERLNFLIGKWDLNADLKFIERQLSSYQASWVNKDGRVKNLRTI